MGDFDNNRFKSSNQSWETPDDLFKKIDSVFHFTRDVCASKDNTKCSEFWSEENSCLNKRWDGINWMNPPYKDMKKFIQKAFDERSHAITVCLIPARTNTVWWHNLCMKGEVWFICGRPKFKGCIHGLPQPLALVKFGGLEGTMRSFYLDKLLGERS
jgi:site-specific DNA-methyltransferase (adenine-specific)